MQRKLKAAFRSSIKRKSQNDEELGPQAEAASPRSRRDVRMTMSFEEQRPRHSSDSYKAQHNSRSRALSSAHDSRRLSNTSGAYLSAPESTQNRPSQRTHDSIASDYKAYLPALSPINDAQNEKHMSLGGYRSLMSDESDLRHEEDVADRNIDRYSQSLDASARKPLPAIPGMCNDPYDVLSAAMEALVLKNYINGLAVLDVEPQELPANHSTGGKDLRTEGGLVDSILPHSETSAHEANHWKNTSWPPRIAREETQGVGSRRRPRGSVNEVEESQRTPKSTGNGQHLPARSKGIPSDVNTAFDEQDGIHTEIEQLLDGVVDLKNTVDEDKDVKWAPTVTHEIVKPHEHEIIQHKIFRDIHNYDYYHRIQPVYHLEVLPPRHWIPNPDGQGLIEISADELPSRTGNNRRWKIIHEEKELPESSGSTWRKEPQIVEHPTTITTEGFERKETTIIHPPTLQDMTDYEGLVQPVHFDHKTGKRWLGEITTMRKLKQETSQAASSDQDLDLSMKELGVALSGVPDESDVPEVSTSPSLKRKPVNGPVPSQLGQLGGFQRVPAVA